MAALYRSRSKAHTGSKSGRFAKFLLTMTLVVLSFFTATSFTASTHATEETSNVDLQLNISPVLHLTIQSNLVTLDLTPSQTGTTFVSQDLPIAVATNNPTGYNLSLTAPSTDLTRTYAYDNGTEYVAPIVETLAPLAGGYTQESFTTNKWGYKIGNTNYQPFATEIALSSSTAPATTDTTTITFATKADITQPAGTYELPITIIATTNMVVEEYYIMQDLTLAECQTFATDQPMPVLDKRDNQVYNVQWHNNTCFMMDNLRTAKGTVLTPADSNINPELASYTIPTADLADGNSYLEGRAHNAANDESGAFYNYCAATAGSVCNEYAEIEDIAYDICPKNWRIPKESDLSSNNGGGGGPVSAPSANGIYYVPELYLLL